MARSAPTAFVQEAQAGLIATLEFKAYDTQDDTNNAGPRSAAQAAQQFRDFDASAPKVLPSPGGAQTYTKAQVDAGYLDRGARVAPLRIFGYVNEGAVALPANGPVFAGPYGPTVTYAQVPRWDPSHYVYDTTYSGAWNNATRLAHVVKTSGTGVFVLDLDNATLKNAMRDYYFRDLNPVDTTKLTYDAVLIDVLGPNNVPLLVSDDGGDYGGFTKYSYVTRNAKLVTAIRVQNLTAAADQKLPVMPNGLVNGEYYADTDSSAAGNGYTQRLIEAGELGMAENALRNPNTAWNAWPTRARLEAEADMLVHAESTLGKGILWCVHLWCTNGYGAASGGGKFEDYSGTTAIDNSKQWNRLGFGVFLLGANGRSYYSFRDDTPGKPHRALDYPVSPVGTPSQGRRRQFQSQFYGGDRWFDRVKLGRGTTTGYTKRATDTSGTARDDLYKRNFETGQVWVNNSTTDRFVTIAGTSADRYVEFASATELAGGSSQRVPARSSLILSYVRSIVTPPRPDYLVDAATSVGATGAVLHAHTTDTTVTGATFTVTGVGSFAASQSSSPFSVDLTGVLHAATAYTFSASFAISTGGEPSTNTRNFTTTADVTAPAWSDSSPQYVVVLDRIQIDSLLATDYEGVDHYEVTRTGGVGGAVVTEIPASESPLFVDTSHARDTDYDYSIIAVDAAGNESSAIVVSVTSAPTPPDPADDDPNAGPHVGRIQS